jgi:hypothetical protein
MAQHALRHSGPFAAHSLPAVIYRSPTSRRVAVAAREIVLTAVLLVGYFLVRGARPDNVALSVRNSLAVAHLEQRLDIFVEPAWQHAVLGDTNAIRLAGFVYVWGMYPVLLSAAIWLALADIERFRFIRRVLLISAVIGIVSYWSIPQAPPRLLPGFGHDLGIVDTIHGNSSSGMRDLQPGPFLNLYAAQPSFHFAWMLLAAIGVAATARRWWVTLLAAAFCAAMWWAIVVTGNHYFLDMAVGVAVVGVAWLLAARGSRWRRALWRGFIESSTLVGEPAAVAIARERR